MRAHSLKAHIFRESALTDIRFTQSDRIRTTPPSDGFHPNAVAKCQFNVADNPALLLDKYILIRAAGGIDDAANRTSYLTTTSVGFYPVFTD
ncbi:MAG: hypothetical protein KDI89_14925, partial [Gammaproteobacteria bacterium]|nr:hypothetical protein [Gammaproteobacteria bacterium]